MQHFLDGALAQNVVLRGEPVKLLMEPAQRNHGNRPVKLRLPEQETQHRDFQINIRYSQHASRIARGVLRQHFHHLYRLILSSFWIVGSLGNRYRWQPPDRQREPFRSRTFDPLPRLLWYAPNRHEV